MTELGQKILKYILSKTTTDNKYIYVPDIRKSVGNPPDETFKPAFDWAEDMGYIHTEYKGYATPQGLYAYITSVCREYLEKEERSLQEKLKSAEHDYMMFKEQRKHDWRIAIFNIIGGGIAGLLTSIIFWLITK